VQRIAKRARLSAEWQRRRMLMPVSGDSLAIPERNTAAEPRCACSSPVVMWEGEYFCVVTGDLSDKCSLAAASPGSQLMMNPSTVFDNRKQE